MPREVRAPQQAHLDFERRLWRSGYSALAGVDEVGAGPLAGPVVTAAVILKKNLAPIAGLRDSKRLSARQRQALVPLILANAEAYSIAWASAQEIDKLNILRATLRAMARALWVLPLAADYALIDARTLPQLPIPQQAIIKGDAHSQSIAAASVLAKVVRDHWMARYDACYPGYGFAQHAGYGTAAHLAALNTLGPCPIHRFSFAPVRRSAARHAVAPPGANAAARSSA